MSFLCSVALHDVMFLLSLLLKCLVIEFTGRGRGFELGSHGRKDRELRSSHIIESVPFVGTGTTKDTS